MKTLIQSLLVATVACLPLVFFAGVFASASTTHFPPEAALAAFASFGFLLLAANDYRTTQRQLRPALSRAASRPVASLTLTR